MVPVRVSLVTYNLWGTSRWPEREPALQMFCDRYRPDVLCVQELTEQIRDCLDKALPSHARVDDGFVGWTTEGNIWWNQELFDLVEHGAADVGITTYPDRRLFWARLRVTGAATTALVCNVHLTDPGTSEELEEGRNSRVREVKHVIAAMSELANHEEAAFLVGDFNDSLAPLAQLMLAGYNSCYAALRQIPPPTMPAYPDRLLESGFSSSFVLDWIVANSRARCIAAASPHVYVNDLPPSDHWPVQAVYELR